ncbi:MAG: sigma-70 family RNA polymerase sigma factor [Acidobacteria bacterium]|nr:sigma-70 family RNA polymerase sigma factor [Acidobacteriota bacterium]
MLVYQAGDREAFDVLYTRYAKAIYNFLRRTAQWPDAADDLLQKTFLNVHTGRHQYRPEAPFRHWIFTIARNVLRDDARQRRRRPVVDANEFDERFAMEKTPQPRSHSPEISLMVSEAVSALPLSQREVIVLNRYQGMSYAEIGVVLGISENAVKQRAFQAMQKLRRSLNIVGRNPREA